MKQSTGRVPRSRSPWTTPSSNRCSKPLSTSRVRAGTATGPFLLAILNKLFESAPARPEQRPLKNSWESHMRIDLASKPTSRWARGILMAALAMLPAFAGAQEEVPVLDTGDTAWMIVATVLVIMMAAPGLALFYGGQVRSKNVLSVSIQIFGVFSLLTVLWVIYGYSLTFTGDGTYIGGLDAFFLKGIGTSDLEGTIPLLLF